jgi:hypothetical protein
MKLEHPVMPLVEKKHIDAFDMDWPVKIKRLQRNGSPCLSVRIGFCCAEDNNKPEIMLDFSYKIGMLKLTAARTPSSV